MATGIEMFKLLVALATAVVYCDEYHPNEQTFQFAASTQHSNVASAENRVYWNQQGQQRLVDELGKRHINKQAKNVIFFLGDGMSVATITASRIYKGQKSGRTGEEEQLSFDKFPFVALSKTYCSDAQVADSACSATAFLTGVKTKIDTIGIDPTHVQFKDCSTQKDPEYYLDSIMDWAQAANKGTGIVTTTTITHATPAGTYAHTANRDWEHDAAVAGDGADPASCDDIAEQLVLKSPGRNFKVVLGGGRVYFKPTTYNDPERGLKGMRRDGKDLTSQWLADHPNGAYVTNRDEFLKLNVATTDSIFGLFDAIHMNFFLNSSESNNPTLEEMTRKSIEMMKKEKNGYVLLIEGGRIDHGHHVGKAKIAFDETDQFDLAVMTALNMTDPEDTLIIVTADHAHTMTISGYPVRGNNILGLVGDLATDGKPRSTLTYADGPGHVNGFAKGQRVDLTNVDTTSDAFMQPAMTPMSIESHAGEDVAIFALGPQAHLFQGVCEQNYIPHVIGYAACIGPGIKFCDSRRNA